MRYFIISIFILLFSGCVPQPQPTAKSCIGAMQLNGYSYDHLAKIATSLREEQKNISSFEGFISTMKASVDDYANIIKSSIYLSNLVRFLPVPYAGEVSNSAKIVSKTLLNLGGAASSLNRYKNSSTSFLNSFDKLNRTTATSDELYKLAMFADKQLLVDARALQNNLQEISQSTNAIAATSQSISDMLDTSSNYLNNAKSLIGISPAQDDKTKVTKNQNTLSAKLGQLNQKIDAISKSEERHKETIEKAKIYSQLALDMDK